MPSRELFVWYRVRREHAAQAHAVVIAAQRSLAAAWPGVQARLLVRDEGDIATWMETYARRGAEGAATGAGIDAALEAAIVAAMRSLDAFIEGERHVEAFDVVAP